MINLDTNTLVLQLKDKLQMHNNIKIETLNILLDLQNNSMQLVANDDPNFSLTEKLNVLASGLIKAKAKAELKGIKYISIDFALFAVNEKNEIECTLFYTDIAKRQIKKKINLNTF